jgi:hypothetical protein
LAAQPEKPADQSLFCFMDSLMGDDVGCPFVGRRKEEKLEGSIASFDRGEGPVGNSLKGKSSGPRDLQCQGRFLALGSSLRWWCS